MSSFLWVNKGKSQVESESIRDYIKKGYTMQNLTYMFDIYKQLHQHPEVSLQEYWTSEFIAGELQKLGFVVHKNIGGTGVVGILEFEETGQFLALRADMDALPMQEETDIPYASVNLGVMHACGHDSHMATLLGTCAYASQNKQHLKGTLMAIFQPAEEVVVGAKAMIEAGIFADKKPHRLVGIHNWPHLPVGSLGIQSGPITAFADRFKVTFIGVGGHGALPHKTIDPIAMATAGIQNALALTQRQMDALYPQVLSFGVIQGGTSFNVIPEKVVVEGTVRTMRLGDREQMIKLLQQAFTSATNLHGGSCELAYYPGVPAVVNDPCVVEELSSLFQTQHPGVSVVSQGLASPIGEDLAYFLEEVPGVLILVGSGQDNGVNELHNPRYLVPQETLASGYKALTSILKHYLS